MSVLLFAVDCESSPISSAQGEGDPGSHSSPGRPGKESESQEEASPRLRRGRRRTDEALLRQWSFVSPPAPPPPDHSSSTPPSSHSPATPVRRPRGRPRLHPRREGGDADKTRGADGGGAGSVKKRKRCRNRKYQNGEYITEKDKVADGVKERKLEHGEDEGTGKYERL